MIKQVFISILSITLSNIGAFLFCIGLTKIPELRQSENYNQDLKEVISFLCTAMNLVFFALSLTFFE